VNSQFFGAAWAGRLAGQLPRRDAERSGQSKKIASVVNQGVSVFDLVDPFT
jgi:hypothetical protein